MKLTSTISFWILVNATMMLSLLTTVMAQHLRDEGKHRKSLRKLKVSKSDKAGCTSSTDGCPCWEKKDLSIATEGWECKEKKEKEGPNIAGEAIFLFGSSAKAKVSQAQFGAVLPNPNKPNPELPEGVKGVCLHFENRTSPAIQRGVIAGLTTKEAITCI